jgi:hypothetical protein
MPKSARVRANFIVLLLRVMVRSPQAEEALAEAWSRHPGSLGKRPKTTAVGLSSSDSLARRKSAWFAGFKDHSI